MPIHLRPLSGSRGMFQELFTKLKANMISGVSRWGVKLEARDVFGFRYSGCALKTSRISDLRHRAPCGLEDYASYLRDVTLYIAIEKGRILVRCQL